MASIFQLSAPCTIFAPDTCTATTQQPLAFERSLPRLEDQNSAGEVEMSYASIGIFAGDLQPQGGNYLRLIHGTVQQVDYLFFVMGNPDLRVGDRATISSARVEIVNTQQFGFEHCEVSLKHMGR
jgi:hypothetical protein